MYKKTACSKEKPRSPLLCLRILNATMASFPTLLIVFVPLHVHSQEGGSEANVGHWTQRYGEWAKFAFLFCRRLYFDVFPFPLSVQLTWKANSVNRIVASIYWRRKCLFLKFFTVHTVHTFFHIHSITFSPFPHRRQCCQVAEIPAKKLKRGRRKKKLARRNCGRILADYYQKVAEKGPQKIFKRSSLFLAMITTHNVHQDEIKFDF